MTEEASTKDGSAAANTIEFGPTARLGMILFLLYGVVYAGFVILNAFAPKLMGQTPIGGVNIAILYGFFLILFAIALAAIYGFLCRNQSDD